MTPRSYDCPSCGGPIVLQITDPCPPLVVLTCPHCKASVAVEPRGWPDDMALVVLGYVFAAIALVFLPPAFGTAGVVCGAINVSRGRTAHGFLQIVLAVTCGAAGMVLGFLAGSGRM